MDASEREAAERQEEAEYEAKNNATSNGDLPDVEPATTPREEDGPVEPLNERFIHEDNTRETLHDASNIVSEEVPQLVPDTLNHDLVTSGGPVPLVSSVDDSSMVHPPVVHDVDAGVPPTTLEHLREDRGDIVPPVVTEEERSADLTTQEHHVNQSLIPESSEILTTDPEQRLEALQSELGVPTHEPIVTHESIIEPGTEFHDNNLATVEGPTVEPMTEPVSELGLERDMTHVVEPVRHEHVSEIHAPLVEAPLVESSTVIHELHPTQVLEPIEAPTRMEESTLQGELEPSMITEMQPEIVKDLDPTAEVMESTEPMHHVTREIAHDPDNPMSDSVAIEHSNAREAEEIQPEHDDTVQHATILEPATAEPEMTLNEDTVQPAAEPESDMQSRDLVNEEQIAEEPAVVPEEPVETYQHTPIDPPKPPTLKSLTSKDPNFTATRYLSMHSNTFTSRPHHAANVSLDLDARNMGSSLTNWYNKIFAFTERFEWTQGWHAPEEMDYLVQALDESFPQICCNMWSSKDFFQRKQRQHNRTAEEDEKYEEFWQWKSRIALAAFCANFACREVFGKSIFGLENPMIQALGSAMSVFAKELGKYMKR